MERTAYHQIAAIEDTHWWFVYRRRLVAHLIEAAGGMRGEAALDIGCGTGGNLPFLKKYCATVSGLDLSEDAIALAHKKFPHGDFRCGDLNRLRELYSPRSFDLISDFNVLYHSWVKSDLQSVLDVYELLRPGGVFIATEPAFSILRRAHDVIDQGARRYTLGQLKRMLEEADFLDVRGTYFNLPALPLAFLLAAVDWLHRPPKTEQSVAELHPPPKWIDGIIRSLLAAELGVIKTFGRVPCGVSIACIARKLSA